MKLSRFDKWGSAEMYNLQILNNTSEAVFRTCDGYCWTPFVRTFVNNLGVWLGMKMINHHCLVMLFLLHKWCILALFGSFWWFLQPPVDDRCRLSSDCV